MPSAGPYDAAAVAAEQVAGADAIGLAAVLV
jgi:hypothetical protein